MIKSSVYIIVDCINNRIKIGKANNVNERISSFSYASINYDLSIELECINQTAAFKIERMFHYRFHNYKIATKVMGNVDGKSEWFEYVILNEILSFIDYLKSADNRIINVKHGLFEIKEIIDNKELEKKKKEEEILRKEKELELIELEAKNKKNERIILTLKQFDKENIEVINNLIFYLKDLSSNFNCAINTDYELIFRFDQTIKVKKIFNEISKSFRIKHLDTTNYTKEIYFDLIEYGLVYKNIHIDSNQMRLCLKVPPVIANYTYLRETSNYILKYINFFMNDLPKTVLTWDDIIYKNSFIKDQLFVA